MPGRARRAGPPRLPVPPHEDGRSPCAWVVQVSGGPCESLLADRSNTYAAVPIVKDRSEEHSLSYAGRAITHATADASPSPRLRVQVLLKPETVDLATCTARRRPSLPAGVGSEHGMTSRWKLAYFIASRSRPQACSQRRHASAQTRQCACIMACRSHSSPQLLQAATQASSRGLVTLAS